MHKKGVCYNKNLAIPSIFSQLRGLGTCSGKLLFWKVIVVQICQSFVF